MGISKIKILGLIIAIIATIGVVLTSLPNGVTNEKIYSDEYAKAFKSNKLDLGMTAEEFQNSYNDSWWYDSPNIIKVDRVEQEHYCSLSP